MVRKTTVALCTAAVLAMVFGSAADARRYDEQWWWHAYQHRAQHCVSGTPDETSAYPSWMKC